jgi:hypothetical protein
MNARAQNQGPAESPDSRTVDWGEYSAAVHRWELIAGRPAPYPTQPGRHGRLVLAPAFVEWLMGLSVRVENDQDLVGAGFRWSEPVSLISFCERLMLCTRADGSSLFG